MNFQKTFFEKSGKTESEIDLLADEILSLSQISPDFLRGQRLMTMMNHLDQSVIGPQHINKSKHSDARQLLEIERKGLSDKVMNWTFAPDIAKADLVNWLKQYFAVDCYARQFKLGDEIFSATSGSKPNRSKPH